MTDALRDLKNVLGEVADLRAANSVLSWDEQTYMPPGGAPGRAIVLSTLSRLAHERFVDDRIGEVLDHLEPEMSGADPDSDDACLLRVTRRVYEKDRQVPSQWVAEFSLETSLAQQDWQKARATADFALFRPHLERIVELRRQYAGFFAPYDSVYDPLLDDFEPGMKTAAVRAIFDALRPQQGLRREETVGLWDGDHPALRLRSRARPARPLGPSVHDRFLDRRRSHHHPAQAEVSSHRNARVVP